VNGVINIPTVSVTVCAPGTTSNCQVINNVQVDTGSFGLRLVSSVVNTASLPISTLASGAQLGECATFADGYTWGTVRLATVQIGGETTARAIPIQIIGDPAAGAAPTNGCGSGSAESTANDLGANGILGIGTALTDCGTICAPPSTAANSNYFTCPGGTCARATVPLNQQVANPVANFAADNNGVIVQMPPVSSTGASSATGTLVFGIGTQSNNALAVSQTFLTDGYGDLNGVYNGTAVQTFFDSGSNAYFFADSSLASPACPSNFASFYCPSAAQTRSITLTDVKGTTTASVSIGILSAATLFGNSSNYAFNDLAGQIGGSFDLGLPFFYGRHMYYGFDLTSTTGQAPYVAF
jgi:Protein of unknown function (DUF3443).